MDKMQNFSDASEDEDDKVSDWPMDQYLYLFVYIFVFLLSNHIFSADVLDSLDIVEKLGLLPPKVYLGSK